MDAFSFLKRSALFFILVAVILWLNGFRLEIADIREPVRVAHAAIGDDTLSGYAWSDLAGWISFAPPYNAGATVYIATSTGALSGYAWNDKLGWLSFNNSDAGAPPSTICSASVNACVVGNTITGWARFLSACKKAGGGAPDCVVGGTDPSSGGWDGWVKFKSTGAEPAYGVNLTSTSPTTKDMSGEAWGSTNVGWVRFKGVPAEDTTFSAYGGVYNITNPPFTPPGGAPSGGAVARLSFLADRSEISSSATAQITSGGATPPFPIVSTTLKDTTGATTTAVQVLLFAADGTTPLTSLVAGTNSFRFRIASSTTSSNLLTTTGTYSVLIKASFSSPQPGTFVVTLPLQVTNLIKSNQEN